MNKKYLLKLADLLEADAKNGHGVRFDLANWGVCDSDTPRISCDTIVCAIGLACLSTEFNEAGFKYYFFADDSIEPIYNYSRGWSAVEKFFDLTPLEACFLFGDGSYSKRSGPESELLVVDRIRNFVAGTAKP